MKEVERLPLRDFTRYCMSIAQVPSSYLSGLTIEEQILWLCSFLTNEVIPTVNNNGEAVEELQELYRLLKDYVDNYFDNLDIQEEVNTKLEEMAQSGELAELIAQYLEAQAVIGFNTCSGLAAAENLANGSFARTMGRNTYNDGYGAFYKIRTRINADVPDGYNIIELTETENLVAEKLGDSNLNSIASRVSTLENEVDPMINKKYIVVGDSYSQGYTPDGNVTGWSRVLKTLLGATDDNYTITDAGGYGFASPAGVYTTLINALDNDSTVTDIIIGGGYNDKSSSRANIIAGIGDVKTLCATKFPNAKIHVALLMGAANEYHGDIQLMQTYYSYGCNAYQVDYWDNLQYVLFDSNYLASDGIHPNQTGQNLLARALYSAMLHGGYTYSKNEQLNIDVGNGGWFNSTTIAMQLHSENNITSLSSYSGTKYLNRTAANLPADRIIKLGKIDQHGIIGTKYYSSIKQYIGRVTIQATGGYFMCDADFFVDKDGYASLYIKDLINDAHNAYQALNNIVQLQIPTFTIVYPTIEM